MCYINCHVFYYQHRNLVIIKIFTNLKKNFMRNLALLNKKMSGWKPVDAVIYLKKCTNASHAESEFVDFLCKAMKKIDEEAKSKRVFLYNLPQNSWDTDMQNTFKNALILYAENCGPDITVSLKKFRPEPEYVYYLIEAAQNGEKVELLFLEELK